MRISINTLKKYYKLSVTLIIVLLGISLIIIYIVSKNKKEVPAKVPFGPSWQDITPGKSTSEDTTKTLGNPMKTKNVENFTVLDYASKNPNKNNEIYVVKDNDKVIFIKEIIVVADSTSAKTIIDKYGKTKYTYYQGKNSYSVPSNYLYVYPEVGLAYIGNPITEKLMEIWYFVPGNIENFKQKWAQDYQIADPNIFKVYP
jgi:hypothetical protein